MGWLLKWCVNRPEPPEAYHIVESYGASFPVQHSVYSINTGLSRAMIMLCHKHNINSPYIVLISCLWFVCMGASENICRFISNRRTAGWGIGFIWIALLLLWLLQTQSRLSEKQIYFLDFI